MPLTSGDRKALLTRSHPLKPIAATSADRISDAVIAHVRDSFAERELIKIRIKADQAAACDRAAEQIAAAVPCELVKRVGRVVVLYRPLATPDNGRTRDRQPPEP